MNINQGAKEGSAVEHPNEKLGEKIRMYRTAINLTQAEFARRLGVTGASVSAYENGIRSPSFDVLLKISTILGISTDELLGRKKETVQMLDVSGLNEQQLSSLRQMVAFFRKYNKMYEALSSEPGSKNVLNSLLNE